MERHREALLWSAIVAKCDANHDGIITPAELQAFLDIVGHREYDELVVPFPRRDVRTDDIAQAAGLKPPKEVRRLLGLPFSVSVNLMSSGLILSIVARSFHQREWLCSCIPRLSKARPHRRMGRVHRRARRNFFTHQPYLLWKLLG